MVLPTYRRPVALARALAGLLDQRNPPPMQLVVVDNDPAGSAHAVVHAAAPNVVYLVEPKPGAAHARNRGIAAAQAPIVALLDDDVVPAPDWLVRLTAPLLDGRADAAAGRVVLDPSVPRPSWFDEGLAGYLTAFDLGLAEAEATALVTANAAFRTELLRDVGGFDPAFGPSGTRPRVGDDTQVLLAVRRLGARVRWLPEAVVVHELPAARLKPAYLLRRAWWQGRSDWLVDADALRARRLGGVRVAGSWLAGQLAFRRREGLTTRRVAFHALCDVCRTAGAVWQAARLAMG